MIKTTREKSASKSKLMIEPVETTPEVALPTEEKTDKLSFLVDKTNEEEKMIEEEKPKKRIFLKIIILLAVFLLGMLLGGFIVYKKGNIFAGKTLEPKPTVAEDQEQSSLFLSSPPTPIEEPVDLTKYTIEVLNGSETKGAAGKLKEALTGEGFNVLSSANATNSAFVKTVINAKKEVNKEYLKKLQDFLSESYLLAGIQELEDTGKTDVVIIIGAE